MYSTETILQSHNDKDNNNNNNNIIIIIIMIPHINVCMCNILSLSYLVQCMKSSDSGSAIHFYWNRIQSDCCKNLYLRMQHIDTILNVDGESCNTCINLAAFQEYSIGMKWSSTTCIRNYPQCVKKL